MTNKEIYDLILKFANYGFNKSHSVAYSIIAYRMAYLKAKYPKYFFSNLLSSVIGSETKTKEYIDEARRLNIKILNPNINIGSNIQFKTAPIKNDINVIIIVCGSPKNIPNAPISFTSPNPIPSFLYIKSASAPSK